MFVAFIRLMLNVSFGSTVVSPIIGILIDAFIAPGGGRIAITLVVLV